MNPTLISSIVLGVMGVFITIYYSHQNSKLAHDNMMKELFAEFNTRYDKLNDQLQIIAFRCPTSKLLNDAQDSQELRKNVIDYFNLCAEEYYWYHHKKRIDKLVWESWHRGMNYWYNNVESIRDLWDHEAKTSGMGSYYITDNKGFFKLESLK
jgi:hypothetical protein